MADEGSGLRICACPDHDASVILVPAAEARAALREILGGREVAVAADGKPYAVDGSLHFNLSHSGEWALIATAATDVGVDIERHRERVSWQAIARRFFGREVADVKEFYRLWVMKEAVLKAAGTGIRGGLAFDIENGVAVTRHGTFCVATIEAPTGYSAAIALRSGPAS